MEGCIVGSPFGDRASKGEVDKTIELGLEPRQNPNVCFNYSLGVTLGLSVGVSVLR